MNDLSIRKIVIVGGGTAGWMAAAPLARAMRRPGSPPCEIVVVESAEIPTVGVGEATLPPIRHYNLALGIDGAEFARCTQATFKLGIEFQDWGRLGHRFFHGFGDYGPAIETRSPYQHWLRLAREGEGGRAGAIEPLEDWSTAAVMAREGRFAPPGGDPRVPAGAFSYAYHFDATLYAAFLRDYAMARGVDRVIGTIVDVELRPEDGFVAALQLADGRRVDGDLFIDCSGARALLIEGALHAGFEDWSGWLPCDSAWAVPSRRAGRLAPFTKSTARESGWQWRIPLQHRTGNGHVYASGFVSDDEAAGRLLAGLDTPALDEPRRLRFSTGRRRSAWLRNVVAIGLSSGFVEPLESTSIQLILDGVGRLIQLFPDRRFQPSLAAEYNRRMAAQYESIRDFIVLHYKLTQRDDTPFWRHCAAMTIPDTLRHQIELFRETGRVAILAPDGFAEPSWVAMLLGLGVVPHGIDPFVEHLDAQALREHFARQRAAVARAVQAMPTHDEVVERLVRAADARPPVAPRPAPAFAAPADA